MSLSIGIIGLPNVGKSTLFNALLKRQVALAANYPFATIEPNVGVVDVPDERLYKLAEVIKSEFGERSNKEVPEKIVPAVVKFHDIAGLVKGASKGEGLGNQFLSHIREVDAIVHVVRAFEDENVIRADSTDPKSDKEIIQTELALADLQVLENSLSRLEKEVRKDPKTLGEKLQSAKKVHSYLAENGNALGLNLTEKEALSIKEYNLLCLKPQIIVYNVAEGDLNNTFTQNELISDENSILLSARIESELCSLDEQDQLAYMKELGITESGLNKVIRKGYEILGLETYFTAGPKEVRAWTINKGSTAPQAAGKIHTDFERGFISAEIVDFDKFINAGGWKNAKEKGVVRLEGRSYVVKDGDVILFRFNV